MFTRHFFPSTENTENEEEWEEVKGDESAENGAPETGAEGAKEDGGESSSKVEGDNTTTKPNAREGKSRIQLPDVPTRDPDDDGPAPKKQKSEA
jgi:hypothetical protein